MLHKENINYNHGTVGFYNLNDLISEDHFLRQFEKYIDFTFIYDLVENTYNLDNGRASLDSIMLIKNPLIQYFYGVLSKRQTSNKKFVFGLKL